MDLVLNRNLNYRPDHPMRLFSRYPELCPVSSESASPLRYTHFTVVSRLFTDAWAEDAQADWGHEEIFDFQ